MKYQMIIEKECDFATSRDLVISSTIFPHKIFILKPGYPRWTYSLSNRPCHEFMNSRRHASDINDIRSQQGANCDSDHFIFRIKYRPNIFHVMNTSMYYKS